MTFLYVDDDPDDAEIFHAALHDVDPAISFVFAEDSQAMLKSINTRCPDFIFIDHNMPGSDGITLLKHIRSTPCFGPRKVIIYSNYMPEKIQQECLGLGVFECWEKTSDFKGLCNLIREMLDRHIQE